jgi:hypothetical protein
MISIRKPKLLPALSCILTFCIVTVVIVDANIPFGYILVQVLKEPESPFLIEILLLVSIVSLLVASFIVDSLRCGILTSLGALGLVFGWVLGMVRFVFYPIYPTPYPAAAKWIPAITSVPFVVSIIGTVSHSIRGVFAGNATKRSLRVVADSDVLNTEDR